jgi:hypothetical protein
MDLNLSGYRGRETSVEGDFQVKFYVGAEGVSFGLHQSELPFQFDDRPKMKNPENQKETDKTVRSSTETNNAPIWHSVSIRQI